MTELFKKFTETASPTLVAAIVICYLALKGAKEIKGIFSGASPELTIKIGRTIAGVGCCYGILALLVLAINKSTTDNSKVVSYNMLANIVLVFAIAFAILNPIRFFLDDEGDTDGFVPTVFFATIHTIFFFFVFAAVASLVNLL